MINQWKNYGDADFWQLGRLVRKHCEDTDNVENKDNELDIIYTQDFCGNGKNDVIVACCYVDITDSWIDKNNIMKFAGISSIDTEEEKIQFAIACIDYYGIHEFQPSFPTFDTTYGALGTIYDWATTKEVAYEWLQDFEVGDLISNPTE